LETQNTPRWLVSLALAGGGIGIAGLLILAFLIAFPQYRPGYSVFTVSMGDILIEQGKWIKPIPNPNDILAAYWIAWDDDGFRISERQAAQYPIIALGDSYTEAPNVARPWTDVLAAAAEQPVRNLAYRGFGPSEYLRVIQRFTDGGMQDGSEALIVGFFEGNDLSNAVNSREKPGEMPWEVDLNRRKLIKTDLTQVTEREDRYPMRGAINDALEFDLVFYENYLWALNGSTRDYRESLNMRYTMEDFAGIRAVMPEACIVVTYFPTKAHIYLPYLQPEYQPILLQKAQGNQAAPGEKLQLVPASETTFDDLLNRLPNMRDVVQEQMEAAGFIFFDLTPVFEAAAARGEILYYTYDTHWNQQGHDLAGDAIARFMATDPCNTSRFQTATKP
jgi:hypothetical protein